MWVEERERESYSGLSKKTNKKEESQTTSIVQTELVGIKQQLLLPSSVAVQVSVFGSGPQQTGLQR